MDHKYIYPHLRVLPVSSPFGSPSPSPIPLPRKFKPIEFLTQRHQQRRSHHNNNHSLHPDQNQQQGNVGNSPHLSHGGSAFIRSSSPSAPDHYMQSLLSTQNRHNPSQHCLANAAVQKSSPICYIHLEDSYEHLDFMWASTAPDRIFRRAFDLIRDHSGHQNQPSRLNSVVQS